MKFVVDKLKQTEHFTVDNVKENFGNKMDVDNDRMANDDDFDSHIITKDSENNKSNEERSESNSDYPNDAVSNGDVLLAGNHKEKETTPSEHFLTF